ncbi:hypothetical protein K227x_37490 [Rubripirellula lacrimiformis]|uniref:Uncharacterized protein n=1 Tax=Rubripirellula lacrimiformis TaxID=1930273 RepID=A0A517NDZ6_9BACT|nr:hypothetical protein [Rubripirellula lacrimiformis]QDT05349.1 hypothetical protein K227x_37490 [Rubripirellula lacrimiformis]
MMSVPNSDPEQWSRAVVANSGRESIDGTRFWVDFGCLLFRLLLVTDGVKLAIGSDIGVGFERCSSRFVRAMTGTDASPGGRGKGRIAVGGAADLLVI